MRESDIKKAAQVTPDTSPQKREKPGQDKATINESMQESNDEQTRKSPAAKNNLGMSEAVPPAKRQKVRQVGS